MGQFFDTLLSNPLLYIGDALSAFAAVGFLIFLGGFLPGIGNVFTGKGHETHQEHDRTRVVWGIFIMMTALGLWEIIRYFFGVGSAGNIGIAFLLLTPLWLPRLYRLLTGNSGGGAH